MHRKPLVSPGDAPLRLEVRSVTVDFQGLRAVDAVTLDLARGEILGLIGPNGAGKTTLVNVLTGFQMPTTGEVLLGGADITRWVPHQRSREGLVRTFQNIKLFGGLSVLENVEAGAMAMGEVRAESRRRAWAILEGLGLAMAAHRRADTLPFGQERRVGIGRAMAMRPLFLLMDEPAAGLNDAECEDLRRVIMEVREQLGCGILLIEHKVPLVFGLCDRIHVLDQGRTIASGTPDQIRADRRVRQAYLGEQAE